MNRNESAQGRRSTAKKQIPHGMSGFTLLELLVAMAIMMVFLTSAIPSFGSLIQNNRLQAEQMDLVSAIALARSEAAKRGVPVTLSAMTPVTTGNEFGNGWVIWVDNNGDGAYQAATETIRVHQALSSDSRLAASTTDITFQPSGFRRYQDDSGNLIQAQFTLCDSRHNATGTQITVLPSGSVDLNNKYVCQ
ncbi:MAG: GspH/FimT family pseudopilin [Rhodocyclaceae bacterium]|nr:GspH/FimT family pseudopilin [Rhodocyclaceae bacterium]